MQWNRIICKFDSLSSILNNIETIRKEKKERFERAKEFSWEKESENLRRMWKTTFGLLALAACRSNLKKVTYDLAFI